ncbi:MAG: hypothetical protein HDR25_08355 [Lachnospiraceae bacterium]|nr:hypothetical protein [Lachnospiraceae bacterium]
MKKTNNRTLELADLQRMLISTCTHLNRPIRKSQFIKMLTDLFEYNTPKQTEFALLDLIEQGKLKQKGHFITTPEFASTWDGTVTSTDEWIIKFLISLKEEAKHDLFFDVYAQEPLTPSCFFKYINMKYPALLRRQDTALAYMEQMEATFPYGLNSNFYMEMNDHPTDRWFTSFFNNPDCRIFIKNMNISKNHINVQVALISGKKRSYRKANADFKEFKENISHYFDGNMTIHIRKSMTAIAP